MKRFLLAALIILTSATIYADTRVKDITSLEGLRDNQLIGYGLVVGLAGTGDNVKNAVFTQKGLASFLDRMGVNIQGATLKTKNIAAVIVTANLQAFAAQGSRLDVKVSAIGDAKSLRGGTLLASLLLGADGEVYAVAQGQIVLSDYTPRSDDVNTTNQLTETNGYIPSGAIVENQLPFTLTDAKILRFILNAPDFTTALSLSDVINNNIKGNTATALDSSTVQVVVPDYRRSDIVDFISEIESLRINPDYKAKIVIDTATGAIVIGDNVQIRPVAITHGNLVITVTDLQAGDYPASTPTAQQDIIDKAVNKRRGRGVVELKGGAALSDLVNGLNKLGIFAKDIAVILNNMKSVGALDAQIEMR